jgi:BMFP domain-containing protein YqiC
MTPNDLLNKFSQQFNTVIGPGIESLGADVRRQVRAAAQASFEKMDFVSREEFEAQKAVLLRTRLKLEALEKQLAELEGQIAGQGQAAPAATE